MRDTQAYAVQYQSLISQLKVLCPDRDYLNRINSNFVMNTWKLFKIFTFN